MTSRRDFIKITGLTGGALVLGFHLQGCKEEEPVVVTELNAWLKIGSDNSIRIVSKNPEIGQGVKTSMPLIVAEELEVEWEKVIVEQAPYDKRLGSQFAGGSSAIRSNWMTLRKVGAAAKELFIQAAANKWQVGTSSLSANDGHVVQVDGRKKISYGELVADASLLEAPEDPVLKDPKNFKLIGTTKKGVDNEKIVTGAIEFGIDASTEGMVYAAIKKSPAFEGTVKSFDGSAALQVPGVLDVVELEGHAHPTRWSPGVAVIANSTWAAFKGKEALLVEWDTKGNEKEDTDELVKLFKQNVSKAGTIKVRDDGRIKQSFEQAEVVLDSEYELPFLAHSTMEPQNYLADVKNGKVRLKGSTQVPGTCRYMAHEATGIDRENIEVDVTRIGGGFGRRLFADYAGEAAFLSNKIGKPVKVVWSREDDMQHDFYRPAGIYRMKASIQNGKLTGWHVNASSTSRYLYRDANVSPHSSEIFSDGFPAGLIPNFKLEYTAVDSVIPTGAWRAPGHNSTSFVIQSFIDEIAHELKEDPLAFRLNLLGEGDKVMPYEHHDTGEYSTERLKNVMRKVAEMSNWDRPAPSGIYRGMACHFIFGSYAALVCELTVVDGKPNVQKFYAAVDCGVVVNMSGAKAQIEGGIIDGMSAALYGKISIKNGSVVESNFDTYRTLRMNEAPDIEVALIESEESPEGLGEISLPPVAPAISNAFFAATGTRVRRLPMMENLEAVEATAV